MAEFQEKFGTLRDRIERKRQEVQSLSDGVSCLESRRLLLLAAADYRG